MVNESRRAPVLTGSGSVPTLVVDATGAVLHASSTARTLLGARAADLLGQSLVQLTVRSDRADLIAWLGGGSPSSEIVFDLERRPRTLGVVTGTASRVLARSGDDVLVSVVELQEPDTSDDEATRAPAPARGAGHPGSSQRRAVRVRHEAGPRRPLVADGDDGGDAGTRPRRGNGPERGGPVAARADAAGDPPDERDDRCVASMLQRRHRSALRRRRLQRAGELGARGPDSPPWRRPEPRWRRRASAPAR